MPLVRLTFSTTDGVSLEAELARPPEHHPVRAGMVLCHPHPLHGGTMRSIVISSLFTALPDEGVVCLRFNFRGVEGSGGTHAGGDLERLDAVAAITTLADFLPPGAPLVLCGWSFGADVALSVDDPALAAWLAIACPLRFGRDTERAARDARPKLLVLAQRDEVRPPDEIEREVGDWTNTTVEVVGGASHFFIGSTDKLVTLARGFVDRLTDTEPRSAP
ncbi:MAG: alpha/beta hydrolase [Acidimicrobiia bacterium]